MGQIVLAEVLAVGRQLVVHKMGQDLLELEEEAFAGGVAVEVRRTTGFSLLLPRLFTCFCQATNFFSSSSS